MKTRSNPWKSFSVRFWDQDPAINDCFGNSRLWTGNARSESEALSKAKKTAESVWFRVRKAFDA